VAAVAVALEPMVAVAVAALVVELVVEIVISNSA
jgi:hypothetical protein